MQCVPLLPARKADPCPWCSAGLQHVALSESRLQHVTFDVWSPESLSLPSPEDKVLIFCWSKKGTHLVTWSGRSKAESLLLELLTNPPVSSLKSPLLPKAQYATPGVFGCSAVFVPCFSGPFGLGLSALALLHHWRLSHVLFSFRF